MTRQYLVTYEWGGRNFSGFAPDVPGCIAAAETLPAIRAQLKGALEAHLEAMRDDCQPIPEASASVTVDMADDPEFPNSLGYYVIAENLEVSLPRKNRTSTRKPAMRELTAA